MMLRPVLLSIAVAMSTAAVPRPSGAVEPRNLPLQPLAADDRQAAGVGGTGCSWRSQVGAGERFAMSDRIAIARIGRRRIVFGPHRAARDLFPFTFDRWRAAGTTVRVMAGAGKRIGTETMDMPARLMVTIRGRSSVLDGTMVCGS